MRRRWFGEQVAAFLDDFPEEVGVVLRIGESDGHDVVDPLRSRLSVRTTRDLLELLKTILPLFEVRGRELIFRTWTVRAYLIGDLIWHRGRLAKAFEGIESPALIVSMKYGESDFFRYLPLNRHFFRPTQRKIIELQARREYEGAGEFPSFVGWEVERYARELERAKNVVGFSVRCQTGGWHSFRRLAFLEESAFWIDLNTAVVIRVLRDRATVETVVAGVVGTDRSPAVLELLHRSDSVVRQLLYLEEFAQQKLFFRRVRIPPLLHVYWDCIFVNDAVRTLMRHLVRDPEAALRKGEAAFDNFEPMTRHARDAGLPIEDVTFMRDTFQIILLARRFFLLPDDPELQAQIITAKKAYKTRWPRSQRQRFRIRTSFECSRLPRRTGRWSFALLVRRRRAYCTVLDHFLTLRALSWIYWLFRARHQKILPKFARKTAMGVDALLR